MSAGVQYFFGRLLPPRPSFPGDITPEEIEAMGRHAGYLRGWINDGVVLVAGPVADPGGPWGLVVLRAADREVAQQVLDNDPVVLAGLGFRYELLDMISAMTP